MRDWMYDRVQPSVWGVMTSGLVFYAMFSSGGPLQRHAGTILLALLVAQLARAPRWLVYSLLAASFACTMAQEVLVDARGAQDAASDRDEAVQIACRALLHGENPWTKQTQLGNAISTGPASIVTALPFVALTGGIEWMTLLFWVVVGAAIVAGDFLRRRDAALVVLPLLQLGTFDTRTMRYWSLDELSFAVLLFVPAWLLTSRRRYALSGGFLGFALLWRASYLFPVVAFSLWLKWEEGATWRALSRMFAGSALVCALVIGAAIAGFPNTIANANPLAITVAKATSPVDGASDLTHALTWVGAHTLPRFLGAVRLALALSLVAGGARLLSRAKLATPFTYVALANLVAFTVVHYAGRFADNFTGPIVIAAVLAIATARATET